MISVAEARALVLSLARVTQAEEVPLRAGAGRVLAAPVTALRTQPPFAGSAMDGYAVAGRSVHPGATFTVIGESAAGHAFADSCGPGQAVRIFTGAPMPKGTDHVVIQEDVRRTDDVITLGDRIEHKTHVRPAGGDFSAGQTFEPARALTPADLTLLAAMNHPRLSVRRKPVVAVIATGDELVHPGETPRADQIVASNSFGVAAMLEAAGAETRILPIARDTADSLRSTFALAKGADLVVTIGGASVGDHDLVAPVAAELGLERAFYKIAMRPGKPLMAGRMGGHAKDGSAMVGLPGNPVSALVCARIFLVPLLRAMLGLPEVAETPVPRPLSAAISANGPRAHYMRARLQPDGTVTVATRQDSSLLSVLASADTLVVRAPNDPARGPGELVDCLAL